MLLTVTNTLDYCGRKYLTTEIKFKRTGHVSPIRDKALPPSELDCNKRGLLGFRNLLMSMVRAADVFSDEVSGRRGRGSTEEVVHKP